MVLKRRCVAGGFQSSKVNVLLINRALANMGK